MADDTSIALQQSLDEIKSLLKEKRKEEEITTDLFTDPRFLEIFAAFFKPVIRAAEDIEDKLTKKKYYSIFDIIGVQERTQNARRKELVEEVEKITKKLKNFSKNLNVHKNYLRTEILGITDARRDYHQRVIRRAVDTLALNITKSAKVLGDPRAIIKMIGIKPIRASLRKSVPTSSSIVVVDEGARHAIPAAAKPPEPTLSEKADKEKAVYNVKIVDVTDEVAKRLGTGRHSGYWGKAGKDDLGEREQYSRQANMFARMLTLGAGLMFAGLNALFKGITDDGPLKGVSKMIASYSLQITAKLAKGIATFMSSRLKPFISNAIATVYKVATGILRRIIGKSAVTAIESGAKSVATVGSKFLGKTGLKGLAVILRKIPVVGLLISIGFAAYRFSKGDYAGGLIDLASGLASTIPVVGTAVSIILDIWNAKRDLESGGVKANAAKGWNKKLTDFFAKTFKGLIYGSIKHLPFADKIARAIGLGDMVDDAQREQNLENQGSAPRYSDKAINANKMRMQSMSAMDKILAGRNINQLSPEERAEYDRQRGIYERTTAVVEQARAAMRNASVAPTDASSGQTPTAGEEIDQSQFEDLPDVEPTPTVTVDRPYVESAVTMAENSDESVELLRKINTNLEATRAVAVQTSDTAGSNVTSVMTNINAGGGERSPVFTAIETSRDTCYTQRERMRNVLLDYRAFA
jgi:hypothetical protein